MIRAILTTGLLCVLLLASCAGVSKVGYSPLVEVSRPPRVPEQVEVFLTQRPDRAYQEIGVLSYRAGTAEKYVDVVDYMKAKAAQLGADAIIMMESSSGPSMPIGYVIATLTDYKAMAIVYKE